MNCFTFVPTNFTITTMTIEDVLQSTVKMDNRQKVILNIMFTQNLLQDKFSEVIKPYDLSGEQYNVLRILRGQKGSPANMCVIQDRMIARTSNTTRLVDKLLLKNLVTRNVCSDNRRKIEVLITQKGLDILAEIDPKLVEYETNFSNNLSSDELEQLNFLIEKYRQ
ncbi:transcriptional regulator SlyA [Flavobacterium sp. TAB 87]|nr:transcriptional regulator SlyA [Flavobacterium sp. TAB 87]